MTKKLPTFYDKWAFVVRKTRHGPAIRKVRVSSLKKAPLPKRSVLEPQLGEKLEDAFVAAVRRAKQQNQNHS